MQFRKWKARLIGTTFVQSKLFHFAKPRERRRVPKFAKLIVCLFGVGPIGAGEVCPARERPVPAKCRQKPIGAGLYQDARRREGVNLPETYVTLSTSTYLALMVQDPGPKFCPFFVSGCGLGATLTKKVSKENGLHSLLVC